MAEYTLPELDYSHGALEPHLRSDQRNPPAASTTAYVKGVNVRWPSLKRRGRRRPRRDLPEREEPGLPPRRPRQPLDLVEDLSPNGGSKPTGELAEGHRRPVRLVRQVPRASSAPPPTACRARVGRCWATTASSAARLLTFQLYDQQANVPLGIIRCCKLTCERLLPAVQERQGGLRRAFWNVVNWADVQERFAAATTTKTSGLIFG